MRFKETFQSCSKRKVWNYARADFFRLNTLIENTKCECIDHDDVNESWEIFTDIILGYMNQCIPSKEVTIRPNNGSILIQENIYVKEIDKNVLQPNQVACHAGINTKSSEIKSIILKRALNNIVFGNLEDNNYNAKSEHPKQYWKYIKNIIKTNSKSETIPKLKTCENNNETHLYTDEEKAECLNQCFSSISSVCDLSASLPPFDGKCNNSLNDIHITVSEVEDIISPLGVNKAIGLDLISHKVLKNTTENIAKPLYALFNKSLQTATFPRKWKESLVLPTLVIIAPFLDQVVLEILLKGVSINIYTTICMFIY